MTTSASSVVGPSSGKGPPNDDLKIYVEESRALPFVSVAIAIRSGSSTEPIGKEGLTRVMVRMLRRGCRGLRPHEIEEKIDALGAEFSADVSPSVITLHADVISRSLDPLVDLLSTMMAEPTFDEVELGKLLRETQGEACRPGTERLRERNEISGRQDIGKVPQPDRRVFVERMGRKRHREEQRFARRRQRRGKTERVSEVIGRHTDGANRLPLLHGQSRRGR